MPLQVDAETGTAETTEMIKWNINRLEKKMIKRNYRKEMNKKNRGENTNTFEFEKLAVGTNDVQSSRASRCHRRHEARQYLSL